MSMTSLYELGFIIKQELGTRPQAQHIHKHTYIGLHNYTHTPTHTPTHTYTPTQTPTHTHKHTYPTHAHTPIIRAGLSPWRPLANILGGHLSLSHFLIPFPHHFSKVFSSVIKINNTLFPF